ARRAERADELAARYGVRVVDNEAAVAEADVLAIAVKPQDAAALMADLGPKVPSGKLVVTLCAGLPTSFFTKWLPEGTPVVRAMTDAGILLGLPRQVAHDLIVQTAIGSAIMLRDSVEHPVTLREAVTSPAGTTISAIRVLENHGVRAALLAALEAARDRARQIA